MKKVTVCLLMMLMPASAFAQSTIAPAVQTDAATISRWQLGVGVAVSDNAYAGQGSKVTPFPLIVYEGERFFFRGITGGAHLLRSDGVVVDAIITTGFNNINASDFNRATLARRGINRDDLEDRDRSIDAGFAASWTGGLGQLRAVAKTDISGSSEGAEYSLEYGYPLQWGGFRITPTAGATFLSSKVADYYYGIHSDEMRRGVPGYEPGSALIPEVGVNFIRPIGAKWTLMINARYSVLPNKISNSPLVDGSHGSGLLVGFSRAF
jgi:outer membrane protein